MALIIFFLKKIASSTYIYPVLFLTLGPHFSYLIRKDFYVYMGSEFCKHTQVLPQTQIFLRYFYFSVMLKMTMRLLLFWKRYLALFSEHRSVSLMHFPICFRISIDLFIADCIYIITFHNKIKYLQSNYYNKHWAYPYSGLYFSISHLFINYTFSLKLSLKFILSQTQLS